MNLFSLLDTPPGLKAGDTAPDISLPNQEGQPSSLYALLKHHWVVLFFYPKDFTPGCTAQACSFRDSYAEFKQANALIFGISQDSEASHQGFHEKYQLPFPLISDTDGQISRAFGVKKTMGILPSRVSFVIAPDHQIVLAYSSQLDPQSHRQKALEAIQAYQGNVPRP